MKAWNKRKRPKHWTKPKWRTKCIGSITIIPYSLITRGLKDKYHLKFKYLLFKELRKMNKKPRYRLLVQSIKEIINNGKLIKRNRKM